MFRIAIACALLGITFGVNAQTRGNDQLIESLKNDDVVATLKILRERTASAPSSRLRFAEKILNDGVRNGQVIEARADVAGMLGACQLALPLYQQVINERESYHDKYGQPRGIKYSLPLNQTYKAASCAFHVGDYPKAFSYLGSIEKHGDTWVKKMGEDRAKTLRDFLDAPRSVASEIKFAREFWTINVPAISPTYFDVEDFLGRTLEIGPVTREQTKEILLLIHRSAINLGDLIEIELQVKQLTEAFGGEDFVMQAVMELASRFTAEKRFAEAESWLNFVSEKGKQYYKVQAASVRAGIAESKGDEAAMLRALLFAFEQSQVPGTGAPFLRAGPDHYVTKRLARYYKEKCNYAEALKYFTALVPGGSGCGTCDGEMRYERDLGIGECLIKLGREDEALEKYLMPYLNGAGRSWYSGSEISRLVVSVYEGRGELDNFVGLMKPLAAVKDNVGARTALRLAEIKISGRKGEIDKLVSEIKHDGGYVPRINEDFIRRSNWQAVAIVDELAKMKGQEVPALKKRYESLLSSGDAYSVRVWLLYALGVSGSTASEEYLRELLARPESVRRDYEEIKFALSLKTSQK